MNELALMSNFMLKQFNSVKGSNKIPHFLNGEAIHG